MHSILAFSVFVSGIGLQNLLIQYKYVCPETVNNVILNLESEQITPFIISFNYLLQKITFSLKILSTAICQQLSITNYFKFVVVIKGLS